MSTLFKKWTDFGFDATACWSTDPKRRVGYGNHAIICVRKFTGTEEAMDYSMDRVECLQRSSDGKIPTKIDYSAAHSHYTWRSLSDDEVKHEISQTTGASETQITILTTRE